MDVNSEKFKFSIVDNIDFTIEERGNEYTALRKVRWGDNDKDYLEIRRWRNTPDGTVMAAKGVTFMTDDGPNDLTYALLDIGYGNTKQVLTHIKGRDDFRRSLNSVLGKDDENYDESVGTLEDEYYDPKELLQHIDQ